MSSGNKSHAAQNQFYCEVCKINIHTEAEYALHEFSKKHCDNLLRIAKNKPIISKQKGVKSESSAIAKEPPKVNIATTPGNFAKYGYFVPGEVYDTGSNPKEFNTDYDPYLQKFAENPLKEIARQVQVKPVEMHQLQTGNITSFKRKKKKKIRTCQICNVTLLTVPEYEAHMRSAQHSWKLKSSGMGVSAHFVKSSTDLHTVETDEVVSNEEQCDTTEIIAPPVNEDAGTTSLSSVFPTLYCDVCHILLNSEQQFNAHVNGKSHNDNVQRKVEMKAKRLQIEIPSPNQLYCFSCKLSLNNLYQYNEHKFGKKHKLKCRRLMKDGVTIPPEERVGSWPTPKLDPNKPVVYPELYEKFLIEQQKSKSSVVGNELPKTEPNANTSVETSVLCEIPKPVSESDDLVNPSARDQINESSAIRDNTPRMIFYEKHVEKVDTKEPVPKNGNNGMERSVEDGAKVKILGWNDVLKCSICGEDFTDQTQFEMHTVTEAHARKIQELKVNGTSEADILETLFRDKTFVKPDKHGRYSCNICSVTTGNAAELHQHISSVVHKQSEEDYRKKRRIEIKSSVNPDSNGAFNCALCGESWVRLVEYNQHLHSVKHRDAVNAEKAKKIMKKKRALLLQHKRVKQKYIISGLKRKDFAYWRKKCETNPGVRTKVTGTATDLNTGEKERIPSLETLEPKIDSVQNATIGAAEKTEEDQPKIRKNHWNQHWPQRPVIEPLMSRHFPRTPARHHRHGMMNTRHWSPYPPVQNFRSHSYAPPFPYSRHQRPPNYQQWPRYPPC